MDYRADEDAEARDGPAFIDEVFRNAVRVDSGKFVDRTQEGIADVRSLQAGTIVCKLTG